MMDENGPKCMKERVLEHSDRSLVAPKDDDRCNNVMVGAAGVCVAAALQSWLRPQGQRKDGCNRSQRNKDRVE